MNEKSLNQNAFPETDKVYEKGEQVKKLYPGMTLRDYFAAKAISGLFANQWTYTLPSEEIAKRSYDIADAMLKHREQNP